MSERTSNPIHYPRDIDLPQGFITIFHEGPTMKTPYIGLWPDTKGIGRWMEVLKGYHNSKGDYRPTVAGMCHEDRARELQREWLQNFRRIKTNGAKTNWKQWLTLFGVSHRTWEGWEQGGEKRIPYHQAARIAGADWRERNGFAL